MGVGGVKLDLFLAMNEPLDERRRTSCFLCFKDKTESLVITRAHDINPEP